MIVKLIIRVATMLLTLVIGVIVEISIFGYSLERIKTTINRALNISVALAIGQILFLIIWAWT